MPSSKRSWNSAIGAEPASSSRHQRIGKTGAERYFQNTLRHPSLHGTLNYGTGWSPSHWTTMSRRSLPSGDGEVLNPLMRKPAWSAWVLLDEGDTHYMLAPHRTKRIRTWRILLA